MTDLNADISEVFNLVGVLLVFVFGYLSVIWPQAQALLEEAAPEVNIDRERFASEHDSYRRLVTGLLIVAGAVLGLLVPLSWRVLVEWNWDAKFNTTRAALLLVDGFLVALVLAALHLRWRLAKRARWLHGT